MMRGISLFLIFSLLASPVFADNFSSKPRPKPVERQWKGAAESRPPALPPRCAPFVAKDLVIPKNSSAYSLPVYFNQAISAVGPEDFAVTRQRMIDALPNVSKELSEALGKHNFHLINELIYTDSPQQAPFMPGIAPDDLLELKRIQASWAACRNDMRAQNGKLDISKFMVDTNSDLFRSATQNSDYILIMMVTQVEQTAAFLQAGAKPGETATHYTG